MRKTVVRKNSYYDSVFLMLISSRVKKLAGIVNVAVLMGTEMNVKLLQEMGFGGSPVDRATPNDLIIAVEAADEKSAAGAVEFAEKVMKEKESPTGETWQYRPGSLHAALQALPGANLVMISLPGVFAAREARRALENNLHVMLFSDHVSLQDEIELKQLAWGKGLLMMGPDCGTAIINGKPLCFANVVRRGNIGLVGASGSGIQEVCCNIDRLGGGISQAIGTGGRDLQSPEVGGIMTLMGIKALKNDSQTRVIVVLSKPPARDVAERVISTLREAGKPCVVHFVGLEGSGQEGNLWFAGNLEETSARALALAKGEEYKPRLFSISHSEVQEIVQKETSKMGKNQKYLRGLFVGGTLADEAMILFEKEGIQIFSNHQTRADLCLKDPRVSKRHTIVDLGDDAFTVGRPHPMIDPSIREERILKEMEDPEVAVLLLDMVLGYGAHADPAGAISESLLRAKEKAGKKGGHLAIVASVTGTAGDFQNLGEQRTKLERSGCLVMDSNAQASRLSLEIIRKVA